MIEVAVLLSIGRHPASGRSRRADSDARALDLALTLSEARIHAVHAGNPEDAALADYLGMGLPAIDVLAVGNADDPLPALADHLGASRPDVVLAGIAAESGEGSGSVPYALAAALGLALAANVTSLDVDGATASFVQALPRGRRRALQAPLPVIATVGSAAPPARQSAFARARAGELRSLPARCVADEQLAAWEQRPARPRPRRLKSMTGATAAERLRVATERVSGGGRVLQGLSPDQAALEIHRYLQEQGVVRVTDI